MDFAEIAKRTSLNVRQLRYVVDYGVLEHRFLTRSDVSSTGRGVARDFTPVTAFFIALTAALRETGLSRKSTKAALEMIIDWGKQMVPDGHPHRRELAFLVLFGSADVVHLEVGDRKYLRICSQRLRLQGIIPQRMPAPLGWREIENGQDVGEAYEPMIMTRFDLAALARRIGQK